MASDTPGGVHSTFTYKQAVHKARTFSDNACSARLFSDFKEEGVLAEKHVYHHKCNYTTKRKRAQPKFRYDVVPASDQALREMRHRCLCLLHRGQLATCKRCDFPFSIESIIESAMTTHFGGGSDGSVHFFPDNDNCRRLDHLCYGMQKDFATWRNSIEVEAKRYFAFNALVNVHRVTHATRCFKKGNECYARLPGGPVDKTRISYCEDNEYDVWSDHFGNKEKRWMLRFEPMREIEDAFMNTHNPMLTKMLGCNNNVMLGMNGRTVCYCTNYNCKPTQKEERENFQKVSEVMIKVLEKQVCIGIGMVRTIMKFLLPTFVCWVSARTGQYLDGEPLQMFVTGPAGAGKC